MNPQFQPPKTDAEFEERAKLVDTKAARSLLTSLRERRKAAVVALDQEIEFYERVLRERGEEA